RQQTCIRRDVALGRRPQGDVAGDDDDGDTTTPDGGANGIFQNVGKLRGVGNQFAVMAAFPKQILRMRLLKVTAADFSRWNLRRDRQYRRAAAMRIEQAVDEMQIAGTARPRTYREFAGDLGFTGGCESRDLLMPDVNPVDGFAFAQRV